MRDWRIRADRSEKRRSEDYSKKRALGRKMRRAVGIDMSVLSRRRSGVTEVLGQCNCSSAVPYLGAKAATPGAKAGREVDSIASLLTTPASRTNDLKKRISLHNSSKGAKYTRGKKWLLAYKKSYNSKSKALKEEYRLKKDKKKREKIKLSFNLKNENFNSFTL